jgi:WD40 repeat protein
MARLSDAAAPNALDPADQAARRDLQRLLDDELHRLPERYRSALVLCHLQGLSSAAAAAHLDCPLGTVLARLSRGRDLLRSRLARRGGAFSAGLVSLELERAAAAVPAQLGRVTLDAAIAFSLGKSGPEAPALLLARQVLHAMAARPRRALTVLLLSLGLISAGAGLARQWAITPTSPASSDRATPVVQKDRQGDSLPAGAIARLGTIRLRHAGAVRAVAFALDGQMIASAGDDGAVRLWDTRTGQSRGALKDTFGSPLNVAFSPDRKIVAMTEGQGSVRVWDATSSRLLHRLEGGWIAISFSSDGRKLYSGSRCWDVVTGRELQMAKPPAERVQCLARSADGRLSAWAEHNESTVFLCGPDDAILSRITLDCVQAVAFSPDGKTAAVGGRERHVALHDVATGKELRRFPGPSNWVTALAFSHDGKFLAASSGDSAVYVWETATGKERHVLRGLRNWMLCVAFSPDGATVAAAGQDHTVHLWDMASGKEKLPSEGHQGAVYTAAFSPDGKVLTTGGSDHVLRFWDISSGRQLRVVAGNPPAWALVGPVYRPPHHIKDVAYAPDGKALATADGSGLIRIWDAATGKELRQLQGHPQWAEAVAFSPDGKQLASGSETGGIRLWNLATGREARQIKAYRKGPLFFTPSGKELINGNRVWDVASAKEVRRFGGAEEAVLVRAQSPDGRLVMASSDRPMRTRDGEALRLFDTVTAKEVPGRGRADSFGRLAFSPDGRLLAYWAPGASAVVVQETATGVERCRFTASRAALPYCLVFSPDGRMLAATSSDTTVLLFDLTGRPTGGPPAMWNPTRTELGARWEALGATGPRAHRAVWELVGAPESVSFLAGQLTPEKPVDAEQFAGLLADLDSESFVIRQRATAELEMLGERAEARLGAALDARPALEVQRRIEAILSRLEQSAQRLRVLRAVEVLEHVGSPEAMKVLDSLGRGTEGTRLTSEARAAVARLKQRQGE